MSLLLRSLLSNTIVMHISDKAKQNVSQWVLSLLLCSVFTFAQAATLKHGVEHDYHEDSLSCEVFAVFSNLGLACTNTDSINFHPAANAFSITALPALLPTNTHYLTPIRAPPLLT